MAVIQGLMDCSLCLEKLLVLCGLDNLEDIYWVCRTHGVRVELLEDEEE